MVSRETIYALSTGAGRAAIAIIRISGPGTASLLQQISGPLGRPRSFCLRTLTDPQTDDIIDRSIVVWLPGPLSFTGEDCAELHVHASSAVISRIFKALTSVPQVRLAEPGEFTLRAVLNGKMDLVEAEGLGDLLQARTEAQRRLALSQTLGKASSRFDSWRERLLLIRAGIEAAVDFADEEGVADAAIAGLDRDICALREEMKQELASSQAAQAIRDGVKVVLAGLPNTGKSSLLNAIARRDAAIVSDIPGTTRDVIEVPLDLGGFPVLLTDTAGLRTETSDPLEKVGMGRTRREIANGDLTIWVIAPDIPGSEKMDESIVPDLVLLTKCDLSGESGLLRNDSSLPTVMPVSSRTGYGLPEVIQALTDLVRSKFGASEGSAVVSERQAQITQESIRLLDKALAIPAGSLELKAEEIRRAADAIGRMTGRTDVEEWLGAIFSRFCIGK